MGSFGIVDRTANIARDGFVEGAPPSLLQAVFAMSAGEIRVIEGPSYTALVRLDEVTPAAQEGDGPAALKGAIATQLEQGMAQDALSLFSGALTNEAGISLDQSAINAVHAQFN
jgi:peptidyl-prolyl cis-trans isomerase D